MVGKLLRKICFVDESLLANCSSFARSVYSYIGLSLLITGALAVVSMTVAVQTIDVGIVPSILAGLFWGLAVVTFDRGILLSDNKAIALVRIVAAVAIGVVVSLPLEMYIMRDEINQELDKSQKEYSIEKLSQQQTLESNYRSELVALEDSISYHGAKKTQYENLMKAEAGGYLYRGASGRDGPGRLYKRAKAYRDDHMDALESFEKKLATLNENHEKQMSLIEESKFLTPYMAGSFLTRLTLLRQIQEEKENGKLTMRAKTTSLVSNWLRIFFIFFEIMPAILKLTLPKTDYHPYRELITTKNQWFKMLREIKSNEADSEMQATGSISDPNVVDALKEFLEKNKI